MTDQPQKSFMKIGRISELVSQEPLPRDFELKYKKRNLEMVFKTKKGRKTAYKVD